MEENLKWKSKISQCSQQSSVLNPYELFVNAVSIYLQKLFYFSLVYPRLITATYFEYLVTELNLLA